MASFWALTGLCVGLWISLWLSPIASVSALIFGIIATGLAYKSKSLPLFLLFLGLGVLVGGLGHLPYPEGSSWNGLIVKKSENYVILLSGFRRYYVPLKGNDLELFDFVTVQGKVGEIRVNSYESQFDFRGYLVRLGAKREVFDARATRLFSSPLRLSQAKAKFLSAFHENGQGILRSILFGEKDYSSTAISLSSELSLTFLFSSSGFLLSSFLRFLERILNKGMKKRRIYLVCFSFSLFAILLSPYKVGLYRVGVSYALRYMEAKKGKTLTSFCHHSLTGLIMACLSYRFVYQDGFLIGFFLCFAFDFSSSLFAKVKKGNQKIARLLFLRLSLLPIEISYNHGFSILSLPFSLLVTPFAIAICYLGFFSFFSFPFTGLLNPLCDFLVIILKQMQSINALIRLPALSSLSLLAFVLLYFVYLYFREVGFRGKARFLAVSFVAFYVISLAPIDTFLTQEVTFINVGQGDSILIRDGLTSVLLDTGGRKEFDMAQKTLIPFLRQRRIYHLDALIASHADFDHIGAKDSLMSHFSVKRFVDDQASFPLQIGNLTFRNLNDYETQEENERSLVITLSFLGERFLFTGDAGIETEKKLLADHKDVSCSILKVGHHGSKGSTSPEFLDAAHPKTAIVSVGAINAYGHPSSEVLSNLKFRGITIRRTDLEGSICFKKARWPFGF